MRERLGSTRSLCPVCMRPVPAEKVAEDGDVYLEKACPEHGPFRTLLWRDATLYRAWGRFGQDLGSPKHCIPAMGLGCPYDCGLCPDHKAETCIAILEVTRSCNLNCPICFAGANESFYEPQLEAIEGMFQSLMDASGPCPVQLSGGEPTVRDDLPEIIRLGRDLGFEHVEVNTNGLRIAMDPEYLQRLQEHGASLMYLQFDGVTEDVYRRTRGKDLFAFKRKAIENCARIKMGVMLVPTLVPGVNDHQIGDIVRFAKEWVPVVKGIHFQPVSYFGRYPGPPRDEDRITLPEVLEALEEQTGGEMKKENFAPRRRRESYCAFGGLFILMKEGDLVATVNLKKLQSQTSGPSQGKKSPAEQARAFISGRWRYVESGSIEEKGYKKGSWEELFERAKTHYLSVSCMPFQDVWNIDLERLERCCTHVVTPDGRRTPLCAHYVTSTDGRRLPEACATQQIAVSRQSPREGGNAVSGTLASRQDRTEEGR